MTDFLRAILDLLARLFARSPVADAPIAQGGGVPVHVVGDSVRDADARFAACVQIVLRHEGGFVDHPADPGGATNHGISLRYARTLGSMLDLNGDGVVNREDILLVTPAKAAMVYRQWFWQDVRADDLPAGIDLVVFDFAVNSGAGRAAKHLQRAVGAEQDGFIGPATLAAVRLAASRPRSVIDAVCDSRLVFLRGLRTWPTFGRGWSARVEDVRARAHGMVS